LAYHNNKEGFWTNVTDAHLYRISAKVYHGDYLLFDLSDIQKKHAKRAVKNAIKIYNHKRLHLSLNFKTPEMVHNFTQIKTLHL